ncbi:MAG: NADH-quinone oxidoreductase subunit NuoG [bacterium]
MKPQRPGESRKPITATIDGHQVTVEAGTTILDAALQMGIYIPHYCYHPKLSVVASCRLCLVEIEKAPKLVPSCSTPIGEGQVIHTQSKKACVARQQQMELLLVNHPLDCPVCDQGGHCQLQRYSLDFGTDDTRWRFPKRAYPKPDLGPFIDLERNRCILCTRCVRFLEEVAGNAELAVMSRGNDAYIGTFMERPLKGEFAGNTIDLCPVGSLTDKVFRFRARVWELKTTPSICPHCAVGCNLALDTRSRSHELIRITARTNPRVNGLWICDKGRFGYDFANSKDRARSPLMKKDGALAQPGKADVIDLVIGQWKAIRDQYGGEALAGLISPRQTNGSLFLFQHLFRNMLGSNHIDHRLDRVVSDNEDGYLHSLRIGALNDPIREIQSASTIFLVGSDLPNELPILNLQVRQKVQEGATLLVAHRRGSAYKDLAVQYCIYRPGTETEFLAALLLSLIREKGSDIPPALASTLADFDCDTAAERCGMGVAALRDLARRLASASSPTLLLGREAWAAPDGIQIVQAFANIAKVIGACDDRHVGISLLLKHSNSRGASDIGVYPHIGPGLVPIESPGKNTHQILRAAAEGSVKSLFIVGEDLLARYPDRALVKEALDKAEFVVVADTFVHETARAADVFLPIATFCESEGTYSNIAGQVQMAKRALVPLSGSATPLRLIQVLARRLGSEWESLSPSGVFEILAEKVGPYQGMTWETLHEHDLTSKTDVESSIIGSECGDYFAFEIARPQPSKDGHLWLQRGALLFDRGGDAGRTPALVKRSDPCQARLSPGDVEKFGISAAEPIVVESPGERVTIPFIVDEDIPTGSIAILGDYDDLGLNCLTSQGTCWVRISQEGEG